MVRAYLKGPANSTHTTLLDKLTEATSSAIPVLQQDLIVLSLEIKVDLWAHNLVFAR